ncbi:imidazole glycerol phosphate synthase subunit HisH [Alloscardovia venturai]|uniref:Imidazole glycerol phosphate synthase subunit HisH n=1 Tax=Alloscardovia venturai TaxID=1769421 RepID=A0ABW2Y4K7_9BIFI
MTPHIVVFDYGFGNVRSMVRALLNVGAHVELTNDIDTSIHADGLVVPGVGAYAACMAGLLEAFGDDVVYTRISRNLPVLGVCVGEQVMFNEGNERGAQCAGLGLIGGCIEKLAAPVVPHMGWNTVCSPDDSHLMRGIENERFYFVHSYAAHTNTDKAYHDDVFTQEYEEKVTTATYGSDTFIAAVEKGPLTVTQFHPEKSGHAGAKLLTNWIETF